MHMRAYVSQSAATIRHVPFSVVAPSPVHQFSNHGE